VDYIQIYLREIGFGDMDWIYMPLDRDWLAGSCEHGNEISGSIKGVGFLD
jgi:hypothetical protein